MSETIAPIRFSRAGFFHHFEPWIKEDGTPGDFYLTYKGQPVTLTLLKDVVEVGFPIGNLWRLTVEEVFKNYTTAKRLEGRQN